MPNEEQTLAALFAGKTVEEQKALLARSGKPQVLVARAAQEPDPAARTGLLAAADREEENARVLEG